MAVGSRQILFSDTAAPAASRDDIREVANVSDNTQAEASTPAATPQPENQPATPPPAAPPAAGDPGFNLDVSA